MTEAGSTPPPPVVDAVPVIRPRDLFLLGYLPVAALVAWCVPPESWPRLCTTAARLASRNQRAKRAIWCQRVARRLAGHPLAQEADRIVTECAAYHHHALLQILRSYRRDAWQPRVALAGREHVEEALRAGKGGILWVAPFVFSTLLTKTAFHQAGVSVSHLSHAGHGVSGSQLGRRLLNPICTAVEDRYLAERLVMSEEQPFNALAAVVQRVRENRLVSITLGSLGRQLRGAPCVGGLLRVAIGAPVLARRTGAALLPVFTVQTTEGVFVTTVEAPLEVDPGLEREAVLQSLVNQYAALLESYVLRWPGQHSGWHLIAS